MLRMIKISSFALIISVLLFACGNEEPNEIASMISVSYPASQEIPLGLGIDIQLINESKYCIIFPVVTGMTLYTMQGGEEVQVNNLITTIGSENVYLYPSGEVFSKRFVGIVPDTSNLSITEPKQFYARFSGYLCEDENVKIVKVIPFTVVP